MADLLMKALSRVAEALRPLSDPAVKHVLCEAVGVEPPSGPLIPDERSEALKKLAETPSADWFAFLSASQDVLSVIDSLRDIGSTLRLGERLDPTEMMFEQWAHLVPNALAVNYLKWRVPAGYAFFQIFGFLDDQVGGLLGEVLAGERWVALFEKGFDWGRGSEEERTKLATGIQLGMVIAGLIIEGMAGDWEIDHELKVRVLPGFDAGAGAVPTRTPRLDDELSRALTVELSLRDVDRNSPRPGQMFEATQRLSFVIPPAASTSSPLAMSFSGVGTFNIRLSRSWALTATATGTPPVAGSIELVLAREAADPASTLEPVSFLGFELRAMRLTARLGTEGSGVRLEAPDAAIVIRKGADAVSEKALGQALVRIPFHLDVAYEDGELKFRGGGASIDLALGKDLGPARIDTLRVGFGKATGGVFVEGSVGLGLKLGPFAASVDGIGFRVVAGSAPDGFGNLGPLHLSEAGFRTPDGVALKLGAIDGYLAYDRARRRYAGVLDAKWGRHRLSLVGLLASELEDGQRGISLFLQGADTFTPGLRFWTNFKLERVAVTFGYNRGFNVEALQSGIRTGLIETLFAPSDPLANLAQTIAQLNTLFPVKAGAYTFGIAARFSWCDLLDLDLGILWDTSNPRLVVVGKVEIATKAGKLKLAAVGVIDWGRHELTLRASLYDSKLGGAVVSGDAGLLVRWKGDQRFALAIGGFHKDFCSSLLGEPVFRNLARFTFQAPEVPLLKLAISGYFAVTAASLQLGGTLDVTLGVAGILTLSGGIHFDALFEGDPFHFVAEAGGRVRLEVAGATIVGVRLVGELSGPRPCRLKGQVTFEVLWWDVTKSFDKSLGGKAPAEPAPVDAVAVARQALQESRNWEAVELDAGLEHVRLRPAAVSDGRLLLHPLQRLTFRQSELPFGVPLAKLGGAPLTRPTVLRLRSATVGQAEARLEPVTDEFARARYQVLSKEQRLAGSGFERMTAGATLLTESAIRFGAALRVDVVHEDVLVGGPQPAAGSSLAAEASARVAARTPALMARLAEEGAKGRALAAGARRFVARALP